MQRLNRAERWFQGKKRLILNNQQPDKTWFRSQSQQKRIRSHQMRKRLTTKKAAIASMIFSSSGHVFSTTVLVIPGTCCDLWVIFRSHASALMKNSGQYMSWGRKNHAGNRRLLRGQSFYDVCTADNGQSASGVNKCGNKSWAVDKGQRLKGFGFGFN